MKTLPALFALSLGLSCAVAYAAESSADVGVTFTPPAPVSTAATAATPAAQAKAIRKAPTRPKAGVAKHGAKASRHAAKHAKRVRHTAQHKASAVTPSAKPANSVAKPVQTVADAGAGHGLLA